MNYFKEQAEFLASKSYKQVDVENYVAELFQDIIYDIDGAVIRKIEVKKHE